MNLNSPLGFVPKPRNIPCQCGINFALFDGPEQGIVSSWGVELIIGMSAPTKYRRMNLPFRGIDFGRQAISSGGGQSVADFVSLIVSESRDFCAVEMRS
jgi:hypothetical protein